MENKSEEIHDQQPLERNGKMVALNWAFLIVGLIVSFYAIRKMRNANPMVASAFLMYMLGAALIRVEFSTVKAG